MTSQQPQGETPMNEKPRTPVSPYIEDGWLCEQCDPDYVPGISQPIPGSWSKPIVNLTELDGYDELIAAAEQRGAYRAACQAFRHAATAFDYPEAGDQYCTWADVAKWLRANADKHDPEHRADLLEGDE